MDTDLTTLSLEDLAALRLAVAAEQERRDRLTDAPTQVADIARAYEADGGDRADLVAALTPDEG